MTVDAVGALESPAYPALSPSLRTEDEGAGSAYELKFLLDFDMAGRVEDWARQRLLPDPHGKDGVYQTTSLYCDTPALDVYHRTKGYRRNKYRVRRYGVSDEVHLEKKTKRGDRVRKRRNALPLDGLALVANVNVDPEPDCHYSWFVRQVRFRGLRPACQVSYERTAFLRETADGPLRLTMDRNLIGVPTSEWELPTMGEGMPLLTDAVILELKFQTVLPGMFRDLLTMLPNEGGKGRGSKYRLCVSAWGLTRFGGRPLTEQEGAS